MEEVWKNNGCHQFRHPHTTNGHLPYAGQRDLLGPHINQHNLVKQAGEKSKNIVKFTKNFS